MWKQKNSLASTVCTCGGHTRTCFHFYEICFVLLVGANNGQQAITHAPNGCSIQETVVLRDGRKFEISVERLVVGDIVDVKSGDRVPADIRILRCAGFKVCRLSINIHWFLVCIFACTFWLWNIEELALKRDIIPNENNNLRGSFPSNPFRTSVHCDLFTRYDILHSYPLYPHCFGCGCH